MTIVSQDLINAAAGYIKRGLNPSPAIDKRPSGSWSRYQREFISLSEFEKLSENANGIGLICGKISGGLEVIDVDTKNDLTGSLKDDLIKLISDQNPELFNKLSINGTPSGGIHFYYKCETIQGNQKLAKRKATTEERAKNIKWVCTIETRGEGGFIMAYPSYGYTIIQRNTIPTITEEERGFLLDCCRSFNEEIEEVKPDRTDFNSDSPFDLTPWEDFNARGDISDMLLSQGWKKAGENSKRIYFTRPGKNTGISADYLKDSRLFKTWSTSTVFASEKAYTLTKVFAILECNGDSKEACRRLESQGYGIRKQKPTETKAETYFKFWEVVKQGKTTRLEINDYKLIKEFLTKQGIYIFKLDSKGSAIEYVKKEGCIIEPIGVREIQKIVEAYINSLPEVVEDGVTREELLSQIAKRAGNLFDKIKLNLLDDIRPDILRDTKTEVYKRFKNGVIRITANGWDLIPYSDINKVIWKSSIKDIEIFPTGEDHLLDSDAYTIARCFCGNPDLNTMTEEQTQKLFYLFSIIGYCLSDYKDPSRPYAVILAEETETGDGGGGSGKGLLTQIISKLSNSVPIDGKSFNPYGDFAWQRINPDTRLVVIQDISDRFRFDSLFVALTDGLRVSKKHQQEFFIHPEDSPKIILTTNHGISRDSGSETRRQRVFEFSTFFNSENKPSDFFNRNQFFSWDNIEEAKFYRFLFHCIRHYLNPENNFDQLQISDKFSKKSISDKYSSEVLEWFTDDFLPKHEGNWIAVADVFAELIAYLDPLPIRYTKKKMRSALEAICKALGYVFESDMERSANNKRILRIRSRS